MRISVPAYATITLDSDDSMLVVTGSAFANGLHVVTIEVISIMVTPTRAVFEGWRARKDGTPGATKGRVSLPVEGTRLADAVGGSLAAQIRRISALTTEHVEAAERVVI